MNYKMYNTPSAILMVIAYIIMIIGIINNPDEWRKTNLYFYITVILFFVSLFNMRYNFIEKTINKLISNHKQ